MFSLLKSPVISTITIAVILITVLSSLLIAPLAAGDTITQDSYTSSYTPASYNLPPAANDGVFIPAAGSSNLTGSILNTGKFVNAFTVSSEDKKAKLNIVPDVFGLDKDGRALKIITIIPAENPPLPEKTHIIGLAYGFGPDGATFNPEIKLTLSYTPADLPAGISEENLVAAYYDPSLNNWVELFSAIDPVKHTITAVINHFSIYAILATEPEPTPTETTVPEPTVTATPEPTQTETPTATTTITPTVKPEPTTTPEPTEAAPILTIPPSTTPEPVQFDTNWPFLYSVIGGVIVISTILSIVFRRRKSE